MSRQVGANAAVAFRGNSYSVPPGLAGTPVECRHRLGAAVLSVSCAPAGGCAASGSYADSSGRAQGFAVSEHNGVWDKAIEIPGLGRLNLDGDARAWSVSCGPVSDCVAGGTYENNAGAGLQGFVTSQPASP